MKLSYYNVASILAVLTLIALVATGGELLYFIPGGSIKNTNPDYVVPVATNPSRGFLAVTTPFVSIPVEESVKVPILPDGTKRLRVWVWPGSSGVNFGSVTVASGFAHPVIASATLSEPFYTGTIEPDIYLIGRSAPATATLLCD